MLFGKIETVNEGLPYYKIVNLPFNYRTAEKVIKENLMNFNILHSNADLNYLILTRRDKPMNNDNLHYVVKEMPNSPSKIQDMLNQQRENGYVAIFVNDYSVIFEKEDSKNERKK